VIAWQNPAAFMALIALAGPLLIHLLQRQRAARLPFPTDRFVRPAVTGAVRLRLPADVLLLAFRSAVLAAVVCALAQPVVVTPGRMRAWDAKIARAIVIDVSESMKAAAGSAAAAAERETRGATMSVRIEVRDLADGVRRAAARLGRAAPARREIVVISDLQRGALSRSAIAAVPSSTGVRFVRVGHPPTRRQFSGAPYFGSDGRIPRPEITVDADRTSVVFATTGGEPEGLRIVGASEGAQTGLVRAVASSGAPGPSREQPIVMTFDGAQGPATSTVGSRWMLETALRLRNDPELARLSPLVRVGTSGGALAVHVGASPDSYAAAVAVRGVLTARQGEVARAFSEDEVSAIGEEDLKPWSRDAPPVDPGAWRHAEDNDARWFWGAALVLLALEMRVRARVKT